MYGLTNNYIASKNTINQIYLFVTWNVYGKLEMFTFKSYVNERSSTGTLSYDADASCPTNLTSKLDFIAGRLYQNGPAYTDPPCLVWNIIHRVQLTKLARIVALDNFVVSFNWERRCKQEAMKNYWSKLWPLPRQLLIWSSEWDVTWILMIRYKRHNESTQ